ncbi:MAG: ABC transporter substrate-binding protein [Ilumatobacteraceae bacterium]
MRKLLLTLLLPVVVLAACGSDDSAPNTAAATTTTAATTTSSGADTPASAAPSSSPAAFPVTVKGQLGDATIATAPQRVLPLTPADLDTVVGLGVEPIAIPTNDSGQVVDFPWLSGKLPAGAPSLDVNAANGLPVEQIAALKPDVIVANGYWDLETYYAQLSAIAPVVHYVNGQNADTWQATTTTIATALGRAAQGDALIAETERVITDAATAHPDLAGKTFDLVIARDAATVSIMRSEQDAMGRNVAALGLKLSDFARSVPGDDLKVPLSVEQLGNLNPDVLFVIGPSGIGDVLAADPIWSSLPVMQRGATVVLTRGAPDALALGFPTALNLQWLTGEIVPKIEAALSTGG